MNLTKRAIDAMTYQGAGNVRDVRWDAHIKGLACVSTQQEIRPTCSATA